MSLGQLRYGSDSQPINGVIAIILARGGVKREKEDSCSGLRKNNLELLNFAHIGNDVNDTDFMGIVGLSVAPVDTHSDVDEVTIWKLRSMAGRSAIREFEDSVVKNRILEI